MFDPKSYREVCDRMVLDAEKIEEMIKMIENTRNKPVHRPFRAVLVAAALVAALGITASAAGIPAVKEFFANVFVTVTMTDGTFDGITVPTVEVKKEEGRTLLVLDQREIDVTDALEKEGEYLHKGDNYEVRVDADGVAWLTAFSADGKSVITFSTQPGTGGDLVNYTVNAAGGGEAETETGVYIIKEGETLGSVEISDEEGQVWNYRMEDGKLLPEK